MAREMKDSGFAWIKEIPLDWGVYNLRYKFTFGKGLPITKENLKETGISVISYGQIHSKANTGTTIIPALIRYVDESYLDSNSDSLVHSEDFIFADTSEDIEGCGNCVYVDTDELLFAGYHTIILRSKEKENNRYLAYLFKSDIWRKQIRERVTGVKLFSISQKILRETTIILPPKTEQITIANFLDTECARIDTVIEQTRASIEEYKKLKQAVITQAVAKGIRPNRPMKDSGIDWIGDIPYDWNVVNAHRIIISTQNGLTRRDLEQSTGHIVLKLKNISPEGVIDYSFINRIQLSNEELEKYSLQDGDFLFVRVNGSKALVGKCAIFHSIDEPVAYNDHIIRVKLSKIIDLYYFQYYLLSNWGRKEIDLRTSTAAGQYTISGESLRDIVVMLPAIEEQKEIVLYLSKVCSIIDCLINKKESLISELENYKKSIIYEYVTGKKEVPL